MTASTIETARLPEEASEHLDKIEDENARTALEKRLGQITVLSLPQERTLDRHERSEILDTEDVGQTERTQQLVIDIANRTRQASEGYTSSNPELITTHEIWDRVYESQLLDIEHAVDMGDVVQAKKLIAEHMVTLELSASSNGEGGDSYEPNITQTRLSLLKLVELGMAEPVVEVSRSLYGVVVTDDGKNVENIFSDSFAHPRVHSVAHIFDNDFSALQIGLGETVDIDPEAQQKSIEPTKEGIRQLDLMGSAIAATIIKKRESDKQEVEGVNILELINHQALKGIVYEGLGWKDLPSRELVEAVRAITKISPDIILSPVYDEDFAYFRKKRKVKTHYRINDHDTYHMDESIIYLLQDGQADFASRLITANSAEVSDILNSDEPGGLIKLLQYHEDLDDTEKQTIAEQITQIQSQKEAYITSEISKVANKLIGLDEQLDQELIKTVLNAHDPESMLSNVEMLYKSIKDDQEIDINSLIGFLIKDRGWNDSSYLDEAAPITEATAEILLSNEFMEFSSHGQLALLHSPEKTEQIIQILQHPLLNNLQETGIVIDALYDEEKYYKLVGDLELISRYENILNRDLVIKVLSSDHAIEFIKKIVKAEEENGGFMFASSVPALNIDRRAVLEAGISTSDSTIQDQILKNGFTSPNAYRCSQTLDIIRQTGLSEQMILSLNYSLLSSVDFEKKRDSIENVFKETQILQLIGQDGPAVAFGPLVMDLIANAEDPYEQAQQICKQLLGNDPLWLRCFKISQLGVGKVEESGYQHGMKVKSVPLALPVATLESEAQKTLIDEGAPPSFAEMSVEQKKLIANLDGFSDEDIDGMQEVEFDRLRPEFQSALLAYRLFETIALTRDHTSQEQATDRNEQVGRQSEWLRLGDLAHATDSRFSLRAILTSGALCGETLGFKGKRDTYPFNLDTVVVSNDVTEQTSYEEKLGALKNGGYGKIVIVFDRSGGTIHQGEEFQGGMNVDHRLVLGGLPATEIKTILLRDDDEASTQSVKRIVVESGIYIPIVSPKGKLLLTKEEYDALREDLNITAVRPQVLDGAMERPNSQGGSNEGAEFIVSQGFGLTPEKWYVKFGDADPDRLWTEILADQLYRTVVPDVVPTTEAIIIEGRIARASKIVELDPTPLNEDARNEAYIMDCLLGNWDAVYNNANIVMSGGHGMRIDTGCGLDYRARGDKKDEDSFTEVVKEIEIGTDDSRLGLGMRQKYPGLTDEMIRRQVKSLQERLTDDRIDQLVDGIRRPKADRERLKSIIKSRRDYIIAHILS